MKYFVKYHTGAGDFEFNGTLDEAKAAADEGAAYTQQSITICDESGAEIACRVWYGVAYDDAADDQENPIRFGDFGFYADWSDFC